MHILDQDVAAVDANLAKLAARGFSIMFSSGDSGSGYVVRTQATILDQSSARMSWVSFDGLRFFTLQEAASHCKTPEVGKGVSGKVLKSCETVPEVSIFIVWTFEQGT